LANFTASANLPQGMPRVERSTLQRWTLLVLFAFSGYLFWQTLEPIWVPVFLGLVIAVGVYPLQEKLLRKFGGKHPGLPAAIITAAVMIVALAILAFVVLVVGHRVIEVANDISKRYASGGTEGLLGGEVTRLLSRFGLQPEGLQARVAEMARNVANVLGRQATNIVTGLFSAIFIFIFTALTSYYLLKEGPEGTSWLVQMVPLPDGQVAQIVRDVRDVTRAMLFSTGVMSLYQGVTSGIGYWIFGVDSPLVWASLTGVASILPAVGTAFIWAPVVIVTIATGHVGKGIGVLVWSMVVVVFVADYILRPKLVGAKMRMNDLLVFIAIFGGIEAFGILGIVLGPLAVAILLSLIRIYETDYRPEGPVDAPDPTRPEDSKQKRKS
jgi:predicted PurR-regulated permease PerM